jgi:hypothetical protein
MEKIMIDRHLIGDVALAVLLAFPTLALARPQPANLTRHSAMSAPMMEKVAAAERTSLERKQTLPS